MVRLRVGLVLMNDNAEDLHRVGVWVKTDLLAHSSRLIERCKGYMIRAFGKTL